MSTKVYVAYRLKKAKDFWPLVRDVKAKGKRTIQKEIVKLYEMLRANIDPESEEYKRQLSNGDDWSARHSIAQRKMREEYKAQFTSPYRNEFNFDVNLGVWEHQGTMYLIPYCDMFLRHVLDFLKKDSRLEDFCYWNNTDQPEGMSDAEWKARGKVWDAIDEDTPFSPILHSQEQ